MYGFTFVLVTNRMPVFVLDGATRPDVYLLKNSWSTGSQPCRYGCWSIVKSSWFDWISFSVVGVMSYPPALTPFLRRPYFATVCPTACVEPASTANIPFTFL